MGRRVGNIVSQSSTTRNDCSALLTTRWEFVFSQCSGVWVAIRCVIFCPPPDLPKGHDGIGLARNHEICRIDVQSSTWNGNRSGGKKPKGVEYSSLGPYLIWGTGLSEVWFFFFFYIIYDWKFVYNRIVFNDQS